MVTLFGVYWLVGPNGSLNPRRDLDPESQNFVPFTFRVVLFDQWDFLCTDTVPCPFVSRATDPVKPTSLQCYLDFLEIRRRPCEAKKLFLVKDLRGVTGSSFPTGVETPPTREWEGLVPEDDDGWDGRSKEHLCLHLVRGRTGG